MAHQQQATFEVPQEQVQSVFEWVWSQGAFARPNDGGSITIQADVDTMTRVRAYMNQLSDNERKAAKQRADSGEVVSPETAAENIQRTQEGAAEQRATDPRRAINPSQPAANASFDDGTVPAIQPQPNQPQPMPLSEAAEAQGQAQQTHPTGAPTGNVPVPAGFRGPPSGQQSGTRQNPPPAPPQR